MTPSLKIEVDQSGKMETSHYTVLAYSNSNGWRYAILIPARVKREVIGQLRVRGLSRSLAATGALHRMCPGVRGGPVVVAARRA